MKRWTTTARYRDGLRAALTSPFAPVDGGDPATDQISDWLGKLRLLQGVPFYYLVADPRMLPQESLRFFFVDENWITALIDGAFSIGNTTAGDAIRTGPALEAFRRRSRQTARTMRARKVGRISAPIPDGAGPTPVSGFLLRSAVLAGWPSLEVAGFRSDSTPANILRLDVIGDVLICLFDAAVVTITFSEPAEALHFGVELPDAPEDPYVKQLKYVDATAGHAAGSLMESSDTVSVPFRDGGRRVVDVTTLAASIHDTLVEDGGIDPTADYTAAEFALEMIEGVQEVDFDVVLPATGGRR